MNLGKKIKNLREQKGLTIEELANRINENVDKLVKYENNEMEPTLDKKLALSIELGVGLDELSYNIEQKYTKIEKHSQEENINLQDEDTFVEEKEEPFSKSSIVYNEDVFNHVFKDSFIKSSIQTAIFTLGYVLCGLFVLNSQFNLFAYLCFGIAIISIFKIVTSATKFKASKKSWLQEYSHTIREYAYYKEYLEISSQDGNIKKIEYKEIVRIIENKNYLIALYYDNVPTFLVIDTTNFVDDELIKVRTALKEKCLNYININYKKEEKKLEPKLKKWNIILWVFALLALFSISLVSLIVSLFTNDNTLSVSLLTYGLSLILPITSIVLGIVSKKKMNFPSSKNTIVGWVMTVGCIIFIALSIVQYPIYKKNNNDALVSMIENATNTLMPDDYNTIYINRENDLEQRNELTYNVSAYQVWTFGKTKEITSLEESIKNNSLWLKNSDNLQNMYGFKLYNDVVIILNGLNYQITEEADYILLLNLTTNEINNLVASTGDQFVTLMYYSEGNYFVAVEFTCNQMTNN